MTSEPTFQVTGEISSLRNPRAKHLVRLRQRSYRDTHQQTVVEGLREVRRALHGGVHPVEAYVSPDLLSGPDAEPVIDRLAVIARQHQTRLFRVSPDVYAKIAYRGASDGILLVIPYLDLDLNGLQLGKPPFVAVVEGVDKPGNLGAILRSADATGIDGLIVCPGPDGGTDVHNPNVIRASLGTLFHVPTAVATTHETLAWLQGHQIQVIAATPHGARPFTEIDLRGPTAIAMGSEAAGLSAAWLQAAHQRATIPMLGQADSLNLASAATLMLYEVVRQRGFPRSA